MDEPSQTLPDTTPQITVDRFVRSRPVGGTDAELLGPYEHTQRLAGPLRKRTHAEWMNDFMEWRSAPR